MNGNCTYSAARGRLVGGRRVHAGLLGGFEYQKGPRRSQRHLTEAALLRRRRERKGSLRKISATAFSIQPSPPGISVTTLSQPPQYPNHHPQTHSLPHPSQIHQNPSLHQPNNHLNPHHPTCPPPSPKKLAYPLLHQNQIPKPPGLLQQTYRSPIHPTTSTPTTRLLTRPLLLPP